MVRKLITALLSEVICLVGITSALGITYHEAPMLRVKVAAGELPPVEKRLPEEPLVVKPYEKIGQYGGTWRRARTSEDRSAFDGYLNTEPLVVWAQDYLKNPEIVPNVAKSWRFSKDSKSITFFLRKGMKWSDGAPFTADDFLFYWNDIILDKELTPLVPSKLKRGGEPGKIEKIDDYTFRLSFAKPYGMIVEVFANIWPPIIYAPAHYLKQFHPKYTSMDKIKKEMEKEGFDNWVDLFHTKNTLIDNPERPTIKAWYPLDTFDKSLQRWIRNPYYWKVDTEGNQLPYIDKVQSSLVETYDAVVLKAIAGELDFQNRKVGDTIANYPILKQYEKKGDYRIIPRATFNTNLCTIFFNFFHKDPILRKLFRDKRFRIALSIAINREEMNELLWKGQATPAQVTAAPDTPWYEKRFCDYYIEYDPKQANEILDEIGLKWDENHEYRLRPDGKRLRSVISAYIPWPPVNVEAMELVKGYWKKIGIEIVVKPTDSKLWRTRLLACDYDIASYAGRAGIVGLPVAQSTWIFPITQSIPWAPMWGLWFSSNGKSGEEPPVDVKRLMEIYEQIPAEISMEKRNELMKEALAIHAKNMWQIGIVLEPSLGMFQLVKNNVGNVPKLSGGKKFNFLMYMGYAAQLFFKK